MTEKVVIPGRKITSTIRYDLFKKHEKYMRFTKDLEFQNMSRLAVTERLRKINEYNDDKKITELNNLINKLKTYQRTRHFMMWHDGSSISAHSHFLMMISCLYDPASHLTDTKFKERHGVDINVQSMVEKPGIYILACCPS